MAATIGKLRAVLSADNNRFGAGFERARKAVSKFKRETSSLRKSLKTTGRAMERMGKSLNTRVTVPIVAAGFVATKAWNTQAQAIAQVEAGLKSTGNTVGFTSKRLQEMASGLQKSSLFGDEEILRGATAQLLTFTNIAGRQFARTQELALDLATRLDGDLKSASIQLGKALNDPVSNLSQLSRAGIQFSEDQEALIKSLAESGQLMKAQNIILQELEKQYGGSAEAAAKAGTGGIKQLQNSIGDLMEEFGKIITNAINPFVGKVGEVVSSFKGLDNSTKRTIAGIAAIAAGIGPALTALGIFASAIGSITLPMAGAVAAVAVGTAAIIRHWDAVSNYFTSGGGNKIFENLKGIVKNATEIILDTWEEFGQDLTSSFEKSLGLALDAFKLFTSQVSNQLAQLNDRTKTELNVFEDSWLTTINKLSGKVNIFFNEVIESALEAFNIIGNDSERAAKNAERSFDRAFNSLLKFRQKLNKEHKAVVDIVLSNDDELKDSINSLGKDLSLDLKPLALSMRPDTSGLTRQMKTIFRDGKLIDVPVKISPIISNQDDLKASINELGNIMPDLGEKMFPPKSLGAMQERLSALRESLLYATDPEIISTLTSAIEDLEARLNKLTDTASKSASTFESVFTSATEAGAKSMEEFGKIVYNTTRRILAAELAQSIAVTVRKALQTVPFPFNIAAAAGAGAAAAGLFNSVVPKLAEGGLAMGPTLAMVGDNRNANIDPEVIAPLSKLQGLVGQGSRPTMVSTTIKIDGTQLLRAITEAERNFHR